MPIKFSCPKCGQELNVKDEMAGKQGKCPKCKSTVTVPTPAPPRAAAAPPVRKKPVEEVEEVEEAEEIDEAEVAEEDEPPRRRSKAVKKGKNDFDFTDDEEEDTRVSSRRSSRRPRDDDEEDEDEPRRKKKSRRDEEDEDEPRRGKRVSAKRRRDDDEDDYDDDEDEGGGSDKRKKARERKRRRAWQKVGTGVFLNFISLCTYTAAWGIMVLVFVIVVIMLLSSKPTIGPRGGTGFIEILGYLIEGLFYVSGILFVVGGAFLVMAPGKNGDMGLGIATLAVGSVAVLFLLYLRLSYSFSPVGVLAAAGAPGSGISALIYFWPMVELGRLSLFAFFLWAVGKSLKDQALTATSLLLGIVIPSAAFSGVLFIYLLGLIVSSKAMAYLFLFVVFCVLAGWVGLLAWFTMHTSSAKTAIDYAR